MKTRKTKTRKTNPVPRLPSTRGVRTYTTQSGWLRAVQRINPHADVKTHAGTMTAIGIGVWSGTEGVILPSIERVGMKGRGHGGVVTRKRVVKKGAPRSGPARTRTAAKRRKNPASSPALGMSKKAYVNRPSQAGKKKPSSRLKKRRGYAYIMANRGFKGAFPNPLVKWQWQEFDVHTNKDGSFKIAGTHNARGNITVFDKAKLVDFLDALRKRRFLANQSNSRTVRMEGTSDVRVLYATEDEFPLGLLTRLN